MIDAIAQAKTYFIKPGYRPNAAVMTHDAVSGEPYWNASRLALSLRYQYPVYRLAGQLIAQGGIRRVLDVGCGVATKLELLHRASPQVEFVGVDQPSTIEFCRGRYRFGEWVADDLEHPSADPAQLSGDLVICADVIEHMGDPDVLLRYLRARVRPGGRILLSTPERDALRGPDCSFSPNRYHVREWNQAELTAYLRAAGFTILEQWLQLPVRVELSSLFFTHVVKPALRGRPVRSNQVCLLRAS